MISTFLDAKKQFTEAALDIACKLTDYFTPSATKEIRIALQNELLFIAKNYDRVVGFATINKTSEKQAEITWIGIVPEFQSHGIGTSLLKEAEDHLTKTNIHSLIVKTLADTAESSEYERTRNFYIKNGFRLKEIIDPYPGWDPGNPCAIYEKDLDAGD